MTDDPQQPLPGFTRRANQISKQASKARRFAAAYEHDRQLALTIAPVALARLVRLKGLSDEIKRDSRIPVEHGQDHEQYVRERVARNLVGTFEPRPGTPGTRGNCPPDRHETGCPYVRCRYHLWRIDGGVDGERAGRPGLGQVPRNRRGLTLRVLGDVGELDRAGTTLDPRWLEHPLPPSCALDVADQGAHSNEDVGAVINRHRTLVARVNDAGCRNVRDAGGDVRLLVRDRGAE